MSFLGLYYFIGKLVILLGFMILPGRIYHYFSCIPLRSKRCRNDIFIFIIFFCLIFFKLTGKTVFICSCSISNKVKTDYLRVYIVIFFIIIIPIYRFSFISFSFLTLLFSHRSVRYNSNIF